MNRQIFVLIVVAVLVTGVTAYAHHSFTSTYHDDKNVRIEGKILQFQFRNPHSFVTIEAPDDKGQMQRWGVEWGGATQLGSQGVTRYTLKAGDIVVVTGRPGRTESDHRILMRTLLRKSDGLNWGQREGEVVD
jgi:hypothetical protein